MKRKSNNISPSLCSFPFYLCFLEDVYCNNKSDSHDLMLVAVGFNADCARVCWSAFEVWVVDSALYALA